MVPIEQLTTVEIVQDRVQAQQATNALQRKCGAFEYKHASSGRIA